MKTPILLFAAILMAWATSAQTTFSVPERTPEQQYPRLVLLLNYNINVAISYAKSHGQTVEEFGKYCGDLYKETWSKEGGFQTFVTGNLMNLTDLSEKVEIVNQTDKKVTLKVIGFYPNLRNNEPIHNVTYDEFIRFFKASHDLIAEYLGCTVSFKILDDGLEVVLESTPDKEYVESLYQAGIELHRKAEQTRNRSLDNRAAGIFKKVIELEPNHAPSLIQLGWIYNSKETKRFWEEGFLDSAFYFANRALQADDKSASVYGLLSTLNQTKGNYDEALKISEKSLMFDPGQSGVYRFMGNLYFNTCDYPKAVEMNIKQLEQDKANGDNFYTLNAMFSQLGRTGFIKESEVYNKRLLKLNNDSSAYFQNLMFEYFLLDDYEAVNKMATERLKKKPDDLNCKYFLVWSNLFQKNYDEAYQWLNEIHEVSVTEGRQVNPNPWFGYAFSKKGKNKEAEEHFSGAILQANRQIQANIYPEINLPYLTLASVYSAKGETEKALEALGKNKSYHLQTVIFLKQDPMLENIRNEPKFQKILKETVRKYENAHKEVGKILATHGLLNN
ncbi:tetratricopeptide repeat protein [Mariniphaga sp.]|uniref:tetratricopeptide repeat protein n=1 Tax=Mariniphaga sp. TaxID=1954475 RepID=UPI0035687B7B